MSQADRILELLKERPHTCAEILRHVPSIVHSRINDLRSRGCVITHETTGVGAGGSLYTLVSLPETEPSDQGEKTLAPFLAEPDGAEGQHGSVSESDPEQLTLEAA